MILEHNVKSPFLFLSQNPKFGVDHLFDRDRVEYAGYFFRTKNNPDQWLQVDIGEQKLLRYIFI